MFLLKYINIKFKSTQLLKFDIIIIKFRIHNIKIIASHVLSELYQVSKVYGFKRYVLSCFLLFDLIVC